MKINVTKITPTSYAFKADSFEFFAKADPNNGNWIIPSFVAGDYSILRQKPAQLAYNQVAQMLRKNPLYHDTKKIDGATNKRIFARNPVFN